jgi:hypothetical protein
MPKPAAASSVPSMSVVALAMVAASGAESSRAVDDPATTQASPAAADASTHDQPSFTRQAAAFVNTHREWMAALLLLPLGLWFWAWRSHRSAYDEAGLPRGPKL